MLFNSIDFLFFFAFVVAVYYALAKSWVSRKVFLLAASYIFYMAWNPPFVLLLWFSTMLDYVAGHKIAATNSTSTKKLWVGISCLGNLGVLAFFKYGKFITDNVWLVMPEDVGYPDFFNHIILPMGISFYTFQSLSYTIDVYRDPERVSHSLLDFAVYVTFFPQLVAGPIIRSASFLPQLKKNHNATAEEIQRGIDLAMKGFAKKILLADTLAVYVDQIYRDPDLYGTWNHLAAIYAYAFQIYFDFSGYSDIAIGTALILGFRVPVNFNLPYIARGPSDFWRRWHISLSTWLRDYLFISLGGSRNVPWKTYRNLVITMVLGGLWHGAAWGFILWGTFHGIWLMVHRYFWRDRNGIQISPLVSVLATFHLVCLGWIFFRAESLPDILVIFEQFTKVTMPVYAIPLDVVVCIALGFLCHILGSSNRLRQGWFHMNFVFKAYWYVALTVLIFFRFSGQTSFIYFQF
jgi:alginate O-acetyltransferase complex protein AlgI